MKASLENMPVVLSLMLALQIIGSIVNMALPSHALLFMSHSTYSVTF